MHIVKSIIVSIILSLLLFFSACFTQIINAIWIVGKPLNINLGLPFTFYKQFEVGQLDLRTSTNGAYLLYDSLIFFLITLVAVVLYYRKS